MNGMELPRFLAVRVGDVVAVQADPGQPGEAADWWAGQVIHAEGGARCGANSLFQVACIDTGVIRTVNADAVVDILVAAPRDGAGDGASTAPGGDRRRPSPPGSAALEAAHDHGHQRQRAGQGNQEGDGHGG